MKKSIIAVIVALLITGCVGASIFAVGGAAWLNTGRNSVSAAPVQGTHISASSGQTDQVAALQNLIAQYQAREQEYQQREQQLQSQLDQANAQIQTDQQLVQQARALLDALQQRGLIQITNDGQVFITQ